MSTSYTAILATFISFAAVRAFGADKIEGAFGMKLGATFETNSAIGTSKLTDGTPMYEFSTTNGFRSFQRYYLMITPTTKRIYSIWAIGTAENTESAKKEQALIIEILQQKYGAKEKEGILEGVSDAKRVDQGSRYILSKISGFTAITHDLRYYDRELEKLAEKERIREEAKKVNKDGL